MQSYLHKVAGQAINLTGVVSPRLAGRIAFSLFSSTSSPEPKNEKERKLLGLSRAAMREAELLMLPVPAGMVATHRFPPIGEPNGKTYLVVHGWGSRIDYMQGLIRGLRQTGAVVVGLDLPGHGGSTGRRLTVPIGIDAIDAAWRQYGHFDAVIGHSFGGFVAAMSASGPADWLTRHTPDRLVLIAAPVAAEHVFSNFSGAMGFTRRVHSALDSEVKRIAGQPIAFFSAGRMLESVPQLPVLVLHADEDKEVSSRAAQAYGGAGPHVKLEWLNGLGHRRIVNSPATIDAIRKFLV
ncbi:alpha/beta fold hydrolase [Rhizobium sp. TH2]|uniref:alpha/beta hydrolase n=1 Tax=Rhizobium sp. TH2 TaxID=2775403 RepID=UPI00215836D3|nr:alpha/beta fold hydrolase [Rhizobium sp. TH2]UVC11493.1 alpha/beta fold hydrolase [Rhizobium sp. TH2]